ncbi:MAG: hypothetical protein PHV17_03605 [Candidatus Omnitrophica bacterium]|nr:hypothetical protein [Candidatus Omnitrophota bacterium]
MKGLCGIELDNDKIFLSFSSLTNSCLIFRKEVSLTLKRPISSDLLNDDSFKENLNWEKFIKYIKTNADKLQQIIKEEEKQLSLKISDISITIPEALCRTISVEKEIVFKTRRKIGVRDIIYAKRYLQDLSLEWDSFCFHHFVGRYTIDGNNYEKPPLGVTTKKITLASTLVWIPSRFREELAAVINNLDKRLAIIVAEDIGAYALVFDKQSADDTHVLIKVSYNDCRVFVLKRGHRLSDFSVDFSLKILIDKLAEHFMLTESIAMELFDRYISFRTLSYNDKVTKEVSVRNGDCYLNLSINTLNSFVKEHLGKVFDQIADKLDAFPAEKPFQVSLLGRLNPKEAISAFFQENMPYPTVMPVVKIESTALGAMLYGRFRFFEDLVKDNFFHRVAKIYKEYF